MNNKEDNSPGLGAAISSALQAGARIPKSTDSDGFIDPFVPVTAFFEQGSTVEC